MISADCVRLEIRDICYPAASKCDFGRILARSDRARLTITRNSANVRNKSNHAFLHFTHLSVADFSVASFGTRVERVGRTHFQFQYVMCHPLLNLLYLFRANKCTANSALSDVRSLIYLVRSYKGHERG